MIGPTQLTRTLSYRELSAHRSQHCPLYETCLMQAGIPNWKSFTCLFCSMHSGSWLPSAQADKVYPAQAELAKGDQNENFRS